MLEINDTFSEVVAFDLQGNHFGAETRTATTHSSFESRKQTGFYGDVPSVVWAGIRTEKRTKEGKCIFFHLPWVYPFQTPSRKPVIWTVLAQFSALITKMRSAFF